MAHVLANELRKAVLETAIRGNLSSFNPEDTPIQVTLDKMSDYRKNLFESKKEKPSKPTNEVDDIELFEIPDHWKWVQLGDVGTLTRGTGIKKDEVTPTGKPCIRYGQLYTTYKTKFDKTVSFVSESTFEKSNKVYTNDIVMALTGENNFDIALAATYYGDEPIAMGGDMTKWSNHYMNPFYLVMIINSDYGISWKRKMAKGNIIVHISNDKLANIMLPLPPIEEQARIVARVDKLMAKIDEYEKFENELVELKKNFSVDMKAAILQAAMQGKLTEQNNHDSKIIIKNKSELIEEERFDIPANWEWTNLKDIMSIVTGKKDQNYSTQDGKYNFYTCAQGIFKAPNFSFEGESLILPGNGANVGKVTLYNGKFEAYQRTYVVQPLYKELNMKYMYYAMLENWDSFNKNKMYGSAIPYIKLGNLQSFPVALPPIEEQRRIVEKLDKILPLCEELEKEIA